jgi:hypothetical protein
MFFTKRFFLKFLPVAIVGSYLMWLIYYIMDKNDMRDVNIIIVRIGLIQLTFIGFWLYYSQYRSWHIAKSLLNKGIATTAEITRADLVSLNLFATQYIRITYNFNTILNVEYAHTQLFLIKLLKKWFSGKLPKVKDKVDIVYDPDNPKYCMLSHEISYGKTSSTF